MTGSDLARDLLMALDPVEAALAIGLHPDPWQAKLLRSQSPRILLNCSRQAGKSTVSAIIAVHAAVFEPGSLILMLSPSLRQSGELFKKARAAYRAFEESVPAKTESELRLELSNGSRLISLPGTETTIRGYSGVRLLVIDEASRVETATYLAVRPMLAVSGGRLLALSTPFGQRGWWYDAWRSDEPWERYEIPASECPRISAAFLEEERRSMGDFWYRQEYLGQFLEGTHQPFTRDDVERAFREEVEGWVL